jgi:hypothetical protein
MSAARDKGSTSTPRRLLLAGTFATNAAELRQLGPLRRGAAVQLRHEPRNAHDPNAVGVYLAEVRIGWVPRTQNVSILAADALIWNWKVLSVKKIPGKSAACLAIEIYAAEKYRENYMAKTRTRLPAVTRPEFGKWRDEDNIVYRVYCNTDLVYIGSTTQRLIDRERQHLSALRSGSHSNRGLQAAFDQFGEESLSFVRSATGSSEAHVRFLENKQQSKHLRAEFTRTRRRVNRWIAKRS